MAGGAACALAALGTHSTPASWGKHCGHALAILDILPLHPGVGGFDKTAPFRAANQLPAPTLGCDGIQSHIRGSKTRFRCVQ
jgi:hypothetical protein